MEDFPIHLLIDGIPAAAVVLSAQTTILTANERMGALTGLSSDCSGVNWLVGKSITKLPMVIVPVSKPVLRNWDSLFNAARSRLNLHRAERNVGLAAGDQADLSVDSLSAHDIESAKFWENEDRKELAMVDVFIYPRADGDNGWLHGSHKRIRSRMCIRAIRWASDVRFVVTFRRPLNVRQPILQVLPLIEESEKKFLSIDSLAPSAVSPAQSSEDLTALVNKLIPNCMAIADKDGQVLYFSQSWYDFTGLNQEQSLGTGWAQTIHPDDVAALTQDWGDAVAKNSNHFTYEARYRSKDGTYVYFLVRAQPFKDEHGVTQKWYASMLDVNELVLARLESDLRRQALTTLLSQADVSLWGIDQSRNLCIREGTLPWEPTCMPELNEPCCHESRQQIKAVVDDILDSKPFQSSIEHQENDRWYRTRFVADTQQGTATADGLRSVSTALGFTIDVTDVKARAQLQIDNERLAASSRVASEATELKSRFLANMSHEIRTPIAGILGLGEIMRDTDLTMEQKQLCNDMANSATFLLTLVNDILDFSKIEASHMDIEAVPFRPTDIVEGIYNFMILEAKKKNLVLSLDNQLAHDTIVVGDSRRLQQVLTNLLSNAIKFTQDGSVTLVIQSVSSRRKSALQSEVILNTNGIKPQPTDTEDLGEILIQFMVKDTGCGIDDQTMSKLFRPFAQADSSTARKHGGTGLGLTISRQLVELMGGKIELVSTPSVGSIATAQIPYKLSSNKTFSSESTNIIRPELKVIAASSTLDPDGFSPMIVATPIDQPHVEVQRAINGNNRTKPEILSTKGHVLVVEDNAINQKVILYALQKLGYTSTAVWNGQEAIDYMTRPLQNTNNHNLNLLTSSFPQSEPDVILMDCMMPVLDGYQATQMLRIGGTCGEIPMAIRNIPIIALTASTTKGDRERCELAGMNDYLPKPVERAELDRLLTKWIRAATR